MDLNKLASDSGSTCCGCAPSDGGCRAHSRPEKTRSLEPRSFQLQPRNFFFGAKLNLTESKHCEFKNYRSVFGEEHLRAIEKTVCAFANTDGGVLYLGVNDSGQAIGLRLKSNQLTQFDQYLYATFKYSFSSPIDSCIDTKYRPLTDRADTFIVEITVRKANLPLRLLTINNDCFFRRLASSERLFGDEVLSECEQECRKTAVAMDKLIQKLKLGKLTQSERARLKQLCQLVLANPT